LESERSFEEMKEFFDTRATGYEAHMAEKPQSSYWRHLLEAQIPPTTMASQILDLGYGTGLEIQHVLRRQPNAHITCVDLSDGMLNCLRQTYADRLAQLTVVQASYFDYNLGDSAFDIAIACVTMHHWLYQEKVRLYKRILLALKPHGRFIDSDYMVPEAVESSLLSGYLALKAAGKLQTGRFYHIDVPFSVRTERQVLTEAGFRKSTLIEEDYAETFNAAMIVAEK
jgi:tRNA (cmo5U34)-methyltransferase